MDDLKLELGEQLSDIGCNDCKGQHKSAYGFIYKDNDAFGLYYATLHEGHTQPSVGLTLSLGKWWDDDALDERSWIFLYVWLEENEYRMRLLEPTLSHHHRFDSLGQALDRDAALQHTLRDEFFRVADYIVENDPAVNSYLDSGVVDTKRWEEAQKQQPQ